MEVSSNVWIVLVVFGLILGVGGSLIASTTLRPWGQKIPFTTPITDLSIPISGEARHQFNQGVFAYRERSFGRAVDCFTNVINCEPGLAESFHNRARAQANLAKKQNAVADLVAASDIYSRQGTKSGIDWVKADLDVLSQL
ncbi:hypothetical protein [Leptothoe kymatousa]|uniref:Tetratricopeptide repeat protein n=1 Tax=Leptothoe kymatousa TAU-MAC 1615 TaxID=2364775 RepID=A0ABS5XYI7_9CYAN|nr:hypothetical protein [Leptothoe kymatousa]MBT9310701.1 hypothetical protein [Leptothoe kymatousa TAU-MAC 1615]